MPKHCVKCGDQIDSGWFCSEACVVADVNDTSYEPEQNDDHGSSTIFDKERW